jgi:hypothetical protein
MMGAMMSGSPAAPSERDLQSLLDLLACVADPAAAGDRVAQLSAAAAEARTAIAGAQAAQTELATAKAEHDAEVKAERDAHDAKLAAAQQAFDVECNHRRQEIATREAEVADLQARAQRDAAAAAELRQSLQERLDRIRVAAA